ncbi:MAG: M3 family metallopeptidase [Candidatus Paceibacterota bacterium]|jgi:oligopeptidase A
MNTLILHDWKNISAEDTEKKLIALLEIQRAKIASRLAEGSPFTWKNFGFFMDELADEMHRAWSPLSHLQSVANSRVSREVFARCEKIISEFDTELLQNKGLYEAYGELSDDGELTDEQRCAVSRILKKSRLSGVDLPAAEQKKRFGEIKTRIAELQTTFENNLTDSEWEKHITDASLLLGLPDSTVALAKREAEEKGLEGYLVVLNRSNFFSVLENAKNRELRYEFFREWNTRASEKSDALDNTLIMKEELLLRSEEARILGFKNFSEVSIQEKMAESTDEVVDFLRKIAVYSKAAANEEYRELSSFAEKRDGIKRLEAWDIPYYAEELKKEKYAFSEQEWRMYFPLSKVLAGFFEIIKRLYGGSFKEDALVQVWHPDVRFFRVFDRNGELSGGLYMDLYGRNKEKRGGAWMSDGVVRRELADGSIQLPIGYLCANFEPPVSGSEPLLTSEEVETFIHEFGHNMHHLLTKCKVFSVSGTNVEWDAVELPSQFMENFCWEKESILLMSGHAKTGAPIPDELLEKKLATRDFGKGFSETRLFVLSLFDFLLYMEEDPGSVDIGAYYKKMAESLEPLTIHDWNRMPWNFAHIFGSDMYTAGYYNYQWARVLDADAFSVFMDNGKINWKAGEKFEEEVLSRGGSRPSAEGIKKFLGRKPTVDALLRRYGFIK